MYEKSRPRLHFPRSPAKQIQPGKFYSPKELQTILKKSTDHFLKPDNNTCAKSKHLKTSHILSCSDSTMFCLQINPQHLDKKFLASSMTLAPNPKENLINKIQQNKKILERIRNKHLKNLSLKESTLAKLHSQKFLFAPKTPEYPLKSSLNLECANLFKSESLSDLSFLKKPLNKTIEDKPLKQKLNYLTLHINQKWQKFMILKYLDEGSSGKVYLVLHIGTGFLLCLKTIEKTTLNSETLKNLIQEIKIQSSLSHPNILNLYGYTADAEKVYLLLEPCLGSNAYKRLNKKPMPEKEVKKHIKEICSAVEYLHKRDIIHRDIKAENILFHENTAKLCDFGWAVHAPMLRNTQCGTPLYTPPEIVKNEYYDSKVDLWCVGVLTYEMLYGTSPFEIRHAYDLVKIVEEEVFFSKDSISELARNFIENCLSKTPSERVTVRQALDHEFLSLKMESFRNTLG